MKVMYQNDGFSFVMWRWELKFEHYIWYPTWVTDGIQSFHSVQVVVATFETQTHLRYNNIHIEEATVATGWADNMTDWSVIPASVYRPLLLGDEVRSGSPGLLTAWSQSPPSYPANLTTTGNTQTRELSQQQQLLHVELFKPTSQQVNKLKADPRYLWCVVANWCMRSSAGPHCKTHDLSFDEDKQQHKHL